MSYTFGLPENVFSTALFAIGKKPVTISSLLGFILILVLTWCATKIIQHLITKIVYTKGNEPQNASAIYAIKRISSYLIWLLGVIVGFNFIGFDMTSVALLGGALGVGIGFGLQNIFNNLISGIIILLEGTLKVGDFVDLQSGVMGRVSEIGIRYTRITTNDAVDMIVPNSEFINGRVTNWTFGDSWRRMHVPFGVAYGTEKEKVRKAALLAADKVSFTMKDKDHPTEVWLVSLGNSSLDFELVVWVGFDGVRVPAKAHASYLWAIETELIDAGVEIPFPQRDLHIKGGEIAVNLVR